jgi:hypothetical protein
MQDHTGAKVELRDFRHDQERNTSDYLLLLSQYGRVVDLQVQVNHATGAAHVARCQSVEACLDLSYLETADNA